MITYRAKNLFTDEIAFAVEYNYYDYMIYSTDFLTCATANDTDEIYTVEDKCCWTLLSTIVHDDQGNIQKEIFHDFECWWDIHGVKNPVGVLENAFKEITHNAWKAAKGE